MRPQARVTAVARVCAARHERDVGFRLAGCVLGVWLLAASVRADEPPPAEPSVELFAPPAPPPPSAPVVEQLDPVNELQRIDARLAALRAELRAGDLRNARALAITGFALAPLLAVSAASWVAHDNPFLFGDRSGDNYGPGPRVVYALAGLSAAAGIAGVAWAATVRKRERPQRLEYRQLVNRRRQLQLGVAPRAAGLDVQLRF
jgi:hypothetical protein